MWPFRKRPEPVEVDRATEERLDDLEDAVAHINRRFTRLQQQVTRWAREYDLDDEDDGDEFDDLLAEKRGTRG